MSNTIEKSYVKQRQIKNEQLKNSNQYKREQELYQLIEQNLMNSFDQVLTSRSSLIE
jgi:hypothetical protein